MSSIQHDMSLLRIYKQLEILLERLNKLALNEMEKRNIADVEELEESNAN